MKRNHEQEGKSTMIRCKENKEIIRLTCGDIQTERETVNKNLRRVC